MQTSSVAALLLGSPAFAERGLDAASLGAAYLFLLANIIIAAAVFAAARRFLVVSPNRAATDYGLYSSVAFTVLLVATVLENELLPAQSASLEYAAVPQLVLLLTASVAAYRRREPWLVTLAAAATVGAIMCVASSAAFGGQIRPAQWVATVLLGVLLTLLWRGAVSTQRAYLRASSIYLESKEKPAAKQGPQEPWLGLRQWLALCAATFVLTVVNSMLGGAALAQVPALEVTVQAALLLAVTGLVCSVPAVAYWIARRSWMPELTRFVWLVWLIVGFTFTYGNYLSSLDRA